MTECETPKPETAEQFGQYLLEFVDETEFDTPQYQAVSDYLFLKQSEESLKLEQINASAAKENPKARIFWETKARISEQKIALLEVSIYQNQSRVKGYDSAYTHVGIGFEHSLVEAARREAKQLFTEDEEQQRFYVDNLCDTFLDQAQDIINRKRG